MSQLARAPPCAGVSTALDAVPGLVQRRADQVVHRRVDDGEVARVALLRGLQVFDARQQHAAVRDQEAAGFERAASARDP